jgi:hypothetical protein
MEKYKIAILLLWSFFASSIKLELKVKAQSLSEVEIGAKLKLLNKPAVKTIKVSNLITPPFFVKLQFNYYIFELPLL